MRAGLFLPGALFGSHLVERAICFALDLFRRNVPECITHFIDDAEALGPLSIEPIEPQEVVSRDDSGDGNTALFHDDTGLSSIDPVDECVELTPDLGNLHGLGHWLRLAHVFPSLFSPHGYNMCNVRLLWRKYAHLAQFKAGKEKCQAVMPPESEPNNDDVNVYMTRRMLSSR